MRERNGNTKRILLLLLVLNLALSGVLLGVELTERADRSELRDRYTLYIGTNDKDTNAQELSLEECKARVEGACLQYVSGFTLTEADGGWTDGAGNIVREKSLICSIDGAAPEEIRGIVDRLLAELNQSAIMVEHTRLSVAYYEHG